MSQPLVTVLAVGGVALALFVNFSIHKIEEGKICR